jgi:hypothetical protein
MLPFSKPEYVRASKRAILNARVIDAVGLASDSVCGVLLDDKIALEQIHPTYSLALLPLTNEIVITYEDALFYADCFAYEHEIPTIAIPRRTAQSGLRFLLDKRGKRATREAYFHDLAVALESVNALRLGPLGHVEFRHDTSERPLRTKDAFVRLNWTDKYGGVSQEIHLYSLALRQIDPLSEYLCHYRVIESASDSNGLNWLEQNLRRLQFARFGMLPAGVGYEVRVRRVNLFSLLRRRAVARLRDLTKKLSHAEIAKRFYHTNRCGIAHGRSIRRSDFATDFKEIYLDGFVIKLMARLSIEDKLQ